MFYGCNFGDASLTSPTNTARSADVETPIVSGIAHTTTVTAFVERNTNTPKAPIFIALSPDFLEVNTDTTSTIALHLTHTPNPYITKTPQGSSIEKTSLNPLTGISVEDESVLERSPVMVKISNFPREIRPQSGLSKADIVFEYYIGGFMNRFLAVYYGENVDWAGPIRSGRLIDAQLAKNYQGILVYGGADDRVNEVITADELLSDRAIDTRYFTSCPPICGTDTHALEGVFVDTAMMSEWAFMMERDQPQRPYGLDALHHSEDIHLAENLIGATEIEIVTSVLCRSKWVYDPSTNSYLRWEESDDRSDNYVPSIDVAANLHQVDTQNILILFADYVVYDTMLHDIRIHYADGVMPAIFFRNGYQFTGYWSGLDTDKPLQVFDSEFAPYSLAPGKTWIIFVTADSELMATSNQGGWQVLFSRP